MKFDTKIDWDC